MSLSSPRELIEHVEFSALREGRELLRQESQVLATLSRTLDTSFAEAVGLLANMSGRLGVTGVGKAGLIGRKLAATFSSTGTAAFFLHPTEAQHGDLGALRAGDVLLALSNSGESEELCQLLPRLGEMEITLVAITANRESRLARAARIVIPLGAIAEAGHLGLAPTCSAVAMLAVGDAMALTVSQFRGFTRHDFARYHPAGKLGELLRSVRDVMRRGEQARVAHQDTTIRQLLTAKRVVGRRTGAIMLVDDAGELRGIFTDSDLVRLLEDRRDVQLDKPVHEVMTHNPRTIGADASLLEATELLSQYRISELPVIDNLAQPLGIIDITDVIGLMPERKWE